MKYDYKEHWWNDANKEISILQKSISALFYPPQIPRGLAGIEPVLPRAETRD
jgi:hypothetical protein